MTVPAADLIAQAQQATTDAELDAISAQAEGRVTVFEAIDARRAELAQQPPAEEEEVMPEAPVVDPSPTAPPIMLGSNEYVFPPAEPSPPEVLELQPNDYESATSGPTEQISQTAYVHMTKKDGTEFLSPLSNVPYYEAKGYTAGAEEDIPDLVAYWADKAAPVAAAPEPEPAP